MTEKRNSRDEFNDTFLEIIRNDQLWSDPKTEHEMELKIALARLVKSYVNLLETLSLESTQWPKQKH